MESHDIDITLDVMTGESFIAAFCEYLKGKGMEHLISGHGVIKSNPDKSKHLETVTFKMFGYDIDVANLRHEEYATTSRVPTMVLLHFYLTNRSIDPLDAQIYLSFILISHS